MKKKYFFLSFCAILISIASKAQIAGTFSVPATYSTIAAAVNDLNTQGVNGPVTILVDAGYTETAPVGGYTLTATGTFVNPIVFQKNGAGANPQIMAYAGGSATPSSAMQDGVWRFVGSDYITIDGIDIFDPNVSNPATMEFGYGFFKASATDGCQTNVIKNCTILLNKVNNDAGTGVAVDGSRGIDVVNALTGVHTTALVITSASGANSNNKFYSNTIQNCNIGIALIGFADVSPFSFADSGNDVGGSSAGTGNTIINYGGGGNVNPAAAIRTLAQYDLNVSFNTINNNNGTGTNHATTLRGIYLNAATSANATINNNTLTIHGGGTTSQVSVIENASGAIASNNTITISNNLIANGTNSTTTTGIYYGIYNTASCAYLNVANNTFTNNTSNATSGATYLIYNTGAVGTSNNITNNTLSHSLTGATAYTGIMYNIYNTSGTTATSLNISGNTFAAYNHVNMAGTGTIYFIYNLSSSANLMFNANKWNGLVMNHSGGEYFMYNSSSTQNVLAVTNNSITNHVRNAAAGTMYCYYAGSSSLPASTQTFSGNIFSNITATISGTGTFYGIYNSDGATSPYPQKSVFSNTISNVNLSSTGAFYGMYTNYLGDGSGSSGSSIYNNTLDNLSSAGFMYVLYNGTIASPTYPAVIYSNTVSNITSLGATSSIYSAYVFGAGAGTNFYKNRIYNISQNGTSGNAYGIYASTSPTTNIYNNLVGNINAPNSGNTNAVSGLYIGGGTNINAYYNTVYLNAGGSGANFGSSAVYASTTPNVNLRNNIFVNLSTSTGAGITAAYRRSSTTLTTYSLTSNNNLFYAGTPTASNVIFTDGINSYQTLSSYIATVSPRDANSVTENPNFVSVVGSNANFLNINTGTPTQIESGASPISGITDDYAGTIRNVSTPDIGAWEGAYTASADAMAPAFQASGFTSSACNLASRTFTMDISDVTGVATGSLSPRVYYKVNNAPYASTGGTLTSGTNLSGTWTFSMSYVALTNDVISWFVVAQDIVATPNLGAVPGAGFTGVDVNNVTTTPTTPYTYTINPSLAGTYTVGATGTYTTLTDAANVYNVACLTNSVTFVLTDPSYSGNETFPIIFLNNPDASTTNSLLVTPATGVAAVIAPPGPVATTIKFLNARYISFDGVNSGGTSLSVINTHSTTSATIWLASSASVGPGNKNITLKNMTVVGSGTVATRIGILAGQDAVSVTTAFGMDNDFITIQSNTIVSAYYGIYANGTATTVAGGINSWLIDANEIGPATLGNNNIGLRGVHVSNAPGIVISNNKINNIFSTSTASGIYLSSGIAGSSVVQNTLTNITSSSANTGVSSVNAIYVGSSVISSTVGYNTIYSIQNTNATGYGARGIIINTANSTSNDLIHNNMISDIRGLGRNTAIYWPIGISLEGTSGGVNIEFNSVHMNNSIAGVATATGSAAMYINTSGINNIVRNNILSNTFDNITIPNDAVYAIYSSAANGANLSTIDYNNYYVGGTGNVPVLGYVAFANQPNIPALQAGFGGNINSQNMMPVFTATNDLHLVPGMNALIDNLGTPVAGITLDIDGQVRSLTTPDMGADEFTAPNCTTAIGGTITPASYSLCNGQALTITSTSVSTGASTVYQWMSATTPGGPYTNVTGGSGANTPSYVSSALSTGTIYYVLQVSCTTASLTSVSNEATVTINPVPTASISSNSPVCAGQSINFTGGTDIGTIFSWSGPAAFTSTVQNPSITNAQTTASGNYTLVISTPNCSATAVTTSVTVNATNLSIIAAPPALCMGSSATLTAVGNATTYLWSTGATTSSIVVTPTATTVYSVAGTGTTGCTASPMVTVAVTNPTITGTGATVCDSVTVGTLSVNAFAPVSWYATPTSTTVIGTGNTYTATAVTTTTYYAEAVSTTTNNLFVSLAGGNGQLGNMFDIVAQSNIEINGFDMHLSNTITNTVEVWYRPGTWVGFNTSSAGWTQAGTTTVTGMGTGSLTPVPLSFTVPMQAGQTYGFYVTCNGGGNVAYTNGTSVGALWASNTDLQLLQGNGGTYFNVTFTPRCFNGQVKYTKTGCTSPKIPVVLTMGQTPTVTATAASGTICEGAATSLSASGALTYTWNTGATGSIVAVTPTTAATYTVVGDNAGCTDTAYVSVAVNALPSVSLTSSQSNACVNGGTVALTGSPAGGVYTGTNVTGNVFTPGSIAGTYNPSYSVTDTITGCSNSASIAIAVNAPPSVSLTAAQPSVCVNGSTIALIGSPSGGVYAGTNVSGGVFTPGAVAGTFNPAYSYTDAVTSCSNSASTTIIVNSCTGIEKHSALKGLSVYPNPNNGEFTIELDNGINKTVEVTDLTGRIIMNGNTEKDKLIVNIGHLANGVYFVKVKSNNVVEIIRIIKQ